MNSTSRVKPKRARRVKEKCRLRVETGEVEAEEMRSKKRGADDE